MSTERSELEQAAYIVWVDRGWDEWNPYPFASAEDVMSWILAGSAGGEAVVITRPDLRLEIVPRARVGVAGVPRTAEIHIEDESERPMGRSDYDQFLAEQEASDE